jgi:predicted O-methyltransferase YrrM
MIFEFRNAYRSISSEGISSFLRKSFRYIFKLYDYSCFITEAKKYGADCEKDKIMDFVFSGYHGLVRPMQIRHEIEALFKLLKEKRPKYILEIGTAFTGGTLFLLSRAASHDAAIISCDLPFGEFGGGYPIWKVPFFKSFATNDQEIKLIRANSHEESTLLKIKSILEGNELDVLFIDGDHTYQGVKKDFMMYSPLVKKAGFIIFHDIVPNRSDASCEVSQFWQQIKASYEYREIVQDWNQGGFGLGLINQRS